MVILTYASDLNYVVVHCEKEDLTIDMVRAIYISKGYTVLSVESMTIHKDVSPMFIVKHSVGKDTHSFVCRIVTPFNIFSLSDITTLVQKFNPKETKFGIKK